MRLFMLAAIVLMTAFSAIPARAAEEADPYIGKHLYRSYCLLCHGPSGEGGGVLAKKLGLTPPNLASDKYQKKNVEELAAIISGYGRKDGSSMPKWNEALPESNIRHIAAYLSRIKTTSLRFTGNIERGRLIFGTTCVACHGPKGRGDGVLARLINAPMKDFTRPDTLSTYGDTALLAVISSGKGNFMPPWKGTLNDDEITDVGAYLRSLAR